MSRALSRFIFPKAWYTSMLATTIAVVGVGTTGANIALNGKPILGFGMMVAALAYLVTYRAVQERDKV